MMSGQAAIDTRCIDATPRHIISITKLQNGMGFLSPSAVALILILIFSRNMYKIISKGLFFLFAISFYLRLGCEAKSLCMFMLEFLSKHISAIMCCQGKKNLP